MDHIVKVLLIHLPSPYLNKPKWSIPNSLIYLKAYLEQMGVAADILDLADESSEQVFEKLPLTYSFYGMTCYTPQHKTLIDVSKYLKTHTNAIIFAGGRHVSFISQQVLEESDLDLVIRGEGEITIGQIVKNKKWSDIKGITYRDNNKIIFNEERPLIKDLNVLPIPRFDCFDLTKYPGNYIKTGNSKYRVGVMFSRGCFGQCAFCTSVSFWKRKIRFFSFEWISEYIDYIESKGIKDIHINDDNFLIHKNFFEICDLLNEKNIIFQCMATSKSITIEKARKLKEVGCYKVSLGIESGSDELLNKMKKDVNVDTQVNSINILKDENLFVEAFMLIGFPSETDDDIKITGEFIKNSRADIFSLSTFVPFPGVDVWDNPKRYNINYINNDFSNYLHLGKEIDVKSVIFENEIINSRRKILNDAMGHKNIISKKLS